MIRPDCTSTADAGPVAAVKQRPLWSVAEGERDAIQGLVHGDYRLDNMLFGLEGADRALTVVDWQTVSWGPALTDLAYYLGCALPTQDRRAHYDELLRAYHEALGPQAVWFASQRTP